MSLLIALPIIFASVCCILAVNVTEKEHQSTLQTRFSRRPSIVAATRFAGLESILGVMGPLALAAMVSLPFVAPAAAALVPLASLSSMFGRRRRYLDDPRDTIFQDSDILMQRIRAAAAKRNLYK